MEDPVFTFLQYLVQTDVDDSLHELAGYSKEIGFDWPTFPTLPQIKEALNVFTVQKSYLAAFSTIGFDANLNSSLLQNILPLTKNNDENKYFLAKVIILFYIHWQASPSADTLEEMLNGLCIIQKNEKFLELSALNQIDACFRFYISTDRIDLFSKIFQHFHSFIVTNPFHACEVQNLFPEFLHMIIRCTSKDQIKVSLEMTEYISFLNQIYEGHQIEIHSETSTKLVSLMAPFLSSLDELILKFFAYYSSGLSDNMHSSVSSRLSKPFSNLVEAEPPFVTPKHINGDIIENINILINAVPKIELPISFSQAKLETGYKFIEQPTFRNGIEIQKIFNICEKPEISALIRKDVYNVLNIIILSLRDHEPSQIALFSTIAQNLMSDSPYFFDYAIVLMALFEGIKNPSLLTLFWNTLLDTVLFDERINVFQSNPDFILIDQLRSLVFYCLTFDKFSYLTDVFQSLTNRPFLIYETIQRVLSVLNSISADSLANQKLIQIFSSLLIYFQNLNVKCINDESLISMIEDTRSGLFFFIMKVFEIDSYIIRLWVSNMIFLPTFFSFLFEKPARPVILNFIKNYLITTRTYFYYGTIEKLEEIVSLMMSQIPYAESTDLASDLLTIICEFQQHRKRQNLDFFSNMSDGICSSLQFLTATKECSRYLSCAVSFLASLKSKLTSQQFDLLSVSILKVEGETPNPGLFPKLVQLLAGEQISSANPTFMIRQPEVLNLILTCYIHSSNFDDVFSFVKQLLLHSFHNVSESTDAGFDCLLLDNINLLKSDEKNEKKINCFLDILDHICTTNSSNDTPLRYLNLLNPIRKKWLSPFELRFIQRITNVIRTSSALPNAWLPLGPIVKDKAHVKVTGLTNSQLPKAFIIVSWIYLDQPNSQEHNHLFEILDSQNCGFIGFISSGNFLVTNINTNYESTAKIDIPVPSGIWCPISLFIELGETIEDNSHITAFIGPKNSRRIDFNWGNFAEGKISIVVGSPSSNDDKAEMPDAFLSSLKFYNAQKISDITPYIDKERKNIFAVSSKISTNEKKSPNSHQQSFLSISFKSKEGQLSYLAKSKFENFSIESELIGSLIKCNTTFCDVLRKKDIAQLLLPLFTLIDYPTTQNTENKTTLDEFPELLFDLLSAALQVSSEQQEVFEQRFGMQILSFLLNNSQAYVPSYSTYMRIYSNLPSFIPSLQSNVISLFLLDFRNMINSSPQSQLRLAKHWNRVLTKSYPNAIKSITPLLVLIFEQYISDEPNAVRIRQNLNEMVLKIASTNLSRNDLLCLISLPLAAPVEHQSTMAHEVMAMLYHLLSNDNFSSNNKSEKTGIFAMKPDDLRYLSLINLYLQTSDIDIMISLLKLIILIHRSNLIKKFSIESHIEMIMKVTPSFFAQEKVILEIADLINSQGMVELLPLVFFLTANCGDSEADELFKVLNPTPLNTRSLMWALVVATNASKDIQTTVLKYIIRCPNCDDNETAYMIEIISSVMNDMANSLNREHLHIIAQNLIDKKDEEVDSSEIESFFQLAFQFLIFRRTSLSAVLKHEFELSLFGMEIKRSSKNRKNGKKKSSNKHQNNLMKVSCGNIRSISMMFPANMKSSGGILVSRSGSFHKLLLMVDQMQNESSSSNEHLDALQLQSKEIYARIRKYSLKLHPRALGPKLDRNGNWIDKDIGLKCLALFEKCFLPDFIPFDLMISSFLVKKNKSVIEKHLSKLEMPHKQIKANLNSINLLSKFANGKLKVDWIPASFDVLDASLAFEDMQKRKSSAKEKYGNKLAREFVAITDKYEKEIAEASELRKKENAYFIESEVIAFHNRELFDRENAEIYWKKLSKFTSFEFV